MVAAVRVDLRGGSSSGESIGIFIAALITFAVANERDTIFALLISSNRMETSARLSPIGDSHADDTHHPWHRDMRTTHKRPEARSRCKRRNKTPPDLIQ